MAKKTNKELAVELACASLIAMSNMNAPKTLSSTDIKNVLYDCYSLICDLPTYPEDTSERGV